MTPEEAYEEALRRIREAEDTGAVRLDLSRLETLNRLPPELAGLTSLESLKLSDCWQLRDFSPLARLTSLQSLDLSECWQLSDLSPLADFTSLQTLGLAGCRQLRDLSPLTALTSSLQSLDLSESQLSDLSPLAGLTSLQSLNLSWCGKLGDLSPLDNLTSLRSLNLLRCKQLSDLSSLTGLTSLQSLNLNVCLGIRRFAPLESLLPTLKKLYLYGCKLDDLPPEVCGENWDENVLDKVRAHYGIQPDASPTTKTEPLQSLAPPKPLARPPQVFVSYAWGDTSPSASEEDRKRQEVVERLCRTLEKEHWQVVRDTNELRPGDQISTFMTKLGQADLVIVVLSAKYLHSTSCMIELHALYKNAQQEKREFLNRIIPLVLKDASIGTWRGRATYAEYWETEFKAMEQHITQLGEEDLKLYKEMKRWHNDVGDMLAYVNDVLTPHGFDEIVKDDFAALRKMLSQPSAPVRDAPQTPISPPKENASSTIQEVVLLIHGIRDFAEWQDMVATVLAEIPNIEVCPLKYGRFDAFRFWFPVWTRDSPVKNLLWRIRAAIKQFSPAKLSVVAHSFGTYAIGKILRENPDIRLHRLILCGAILPSNFHWDQIQHNVETPIINDCGIKDIWPVLAQSTTFGYGPSGRFGFGTPGVRDRYHDFGHGGFFQKKFVSDFWLPWFRSGNFIKSKAPPPSGAHWHLLTIFQIKWLAILLCVLGISWFALTNVPKGRDKLDNFESSHPTLSWPYDATIFNVYPRLTTLRWLPVSGATHYLVEVQVEIPMDGSWHALPNYPVAVEETSYTFSFVGAQPGRWRVAAVNAKNQNTQYSDWWTFRYQQ